MYLNSNLRLLRIRKTRTQEQIAAAVKTTRATINNYERDTEPPLEMLIALSSSASSNPLAKSALDCLSGLRGAEAHSSVILSRVDENVYRKLGLRLTCTPEYETGKDFV